MKPSHRRTPPPLRRAVLTAALLSAYAMLPAQAQVTAGPGENVELDEGQPYGRLTANGEDASIAGENNAISGSVGGSNEGLVKASAGGLVDLSGGSVENTGVNWGRAVTATGAGSEVRLSGTDVTLSATAASNASAASTLAGLDGGRVQADGGVIRAVGAYARGVQVSGTAAVGSQAALSNLSVVTTGSTWGLGVQAYGSNDPERVNRVGLDNVDISTSGTFSHGIQSARLGALVAGRDVDIVTTGNNSHGIDAQRGGRVEIEGGSIRTSGRNAYGINATSLHDGEPPREGEDHPGTVEASGLAIETTGAGSYGVHADTGASVVLRDSSVATTSASALHADTQGRIAGENLAISGAAGGSNGGLVVALGGSRIDLSGGSIDNGSVNWGRAVMARGAGSVVTLSGTDASLTASAASNGNASSVVAASLGGRVEIDGGTFTGSGDYVRGVAAVGDLGGGGEQLVVRNARIVTDGYAGMGVHVFANDGGDPDVITGVDISDSAIETTGDQAWGLQAARAGGRIRAERTDIDTSGQSAHGAYVDRQASIGLAGGSIRTRGDQAHGAVADDAGTVLSVDGTRIETSGARTYGVNVTDGAQATVDNATVVNSAPGTHGVGLRADGAGSSLAARNTSVTVAGTGTDGSSAAIGVSAGHGATVALTGGSVRATGGDRTMALRATEGARIATDGTALSTQGDNSHAVLAWNSPSAAEPGSRIEVAGGSVRTSGANSYGLFAQYGGATVAASGVDVRTSGDIGRGFYAWQGGVVDVQGGSVATGGAGSAGMQATGAGARINADGVAVRTTGADSYGASAGWDDGAGGTVDFRNGAIQTSGARSHGVAAMHGGAVAVRNSTVQASGAGAAAAAARAYAGAAGSLDIRDSRLVSTRSSGLLLTDSASVTLRNTTVEAAGASIVADLQSAGQTQDVTVGSGSALTVNDGKLLEVRRSTAGMDGVVNLTLQAGATATGNVVDLDGLSQAQPQRPGGGRTNFVVQQGASWIGMVVGINDTSVGDGGSFTDTGGGVIDGNVVGGQDTRINFTNGAQVSGSVQAGSGSSANFSGTARIGENVVANGAAFSFNGPTTIGQSVLGNPGSSFSFAGPANIGSDVVGSGAQFSFSTSHPTQIGGNVDLSSGSSTHGGTPQQPIVIQGSASVDGSSVLGGNLDVQGPLSGSGVIAPGNSVGRQSFGSVTEFGGRYVAEVNAAGQSDLVTVNGDADLSGIDLEVTQENGDGGYRVDRPYTILRTQGGEVRNTFDSAEWTGGGLVALAPVDYGSNAVRVTLVADDGAIDAIRGSLSRNQNAALDGALSVAGRNATVDAALQSGDPAGALDQLSGEAHASTRAALLSGSTLLGGALAQRMRANLGAGRLPGAPTAQAGGAAPAQALPSPAASPLWAQAVGSWQRLDGDGNAAEAKQSLGGLFVGGDVPVGRGWRVGGAAGYTRSDIDVDDRSSSSDADSYSLAVYGGNAWQAGRGQVNLLVGAAHTWHDVDSTRSVTVGGAQRLKGSYDARTMQVFGEVGYALPAGRASTVEPYAGLAWYKQHADGFSESGGDAALRVGSGSDDLTALTLGVRGATVFTLGGSRAATLRAGLGWRHASGDTDPHSSMSFVEGGGSSFRVAGAPIAEDAAVLDLSAEMALADNAAAGLSYSGQFGDGNRQHAGGLYLRVRF